MMDSKKRNFSFLDTMINNIDYMNKQFFKYARQLVKQNIKTFLNCNQSFNPIQAVRQNGQLFFSFIQLNGFVQVNGTLHEMLIGVPKNFPQIAPIYLLSINRQECLVFKINKQQQLIANGDIAIQKNQRGEQYIRFNYPFIMKGWQPKITLTDSYNMIKNAINQPPILSQLHPVKRGKPQNSRQIQMSIGNSNNQNLGKIQSQKLRQIVDSKSMEIVDSNSILSDLQTKRNHLQFVQSRNDFLNTHLQQLEKGLTKKCNMIANQKSNMAKTYEHSVQEQNCDGMLQINQTDQRKIEKLSQRQALKEAERKIKQSIKQSVQRGDKKYGDYKKLIRNLFDKMYDNQSQILLGQ